MIWAFFFAGFIILIVVLKYLRFGGERCPQCHASRVSGTPLCPECGWIYEVPGAEDSDYL
jgi:hypothetical protein